MFLLDDARWGLVQPGYNTLIAERDLGEAGYDICNRSKGTKLFIEKKGKIVGKYESTCSRHGGLYLLEDDKLDRDRAPRFAWGKIDQVLLADLTKHIACPRVMLHMSFERTNARVRDRGMFGAQQTLVECCFRNT